MNHLLILGINNSGSWEEFVSMAGAILIFCAIPCMVMGFLFVLFFKFLDKLDKKSS